MLSRSDRKSKYKAIQDLRKRRIENLKTACELYPSQAAFARKVGMSESMLSQILCGARNMGEVLARDIERGLELPEGWLDKRR